MRYRNIIIALGFLVIIIPALGFPREWKDTFHVITGILVVAFGYLAGKERRDAKTEQQKMPPKTTASGLVTDSQNQAKNTEQ
jgi:uncharacterized membrane protein